MNPARGSTETGAAAEAANRKQADYYRNLLAEHREEIDRAIVDYLEVLDTGRGHVDVESARDLRHAVRKAERERQALDRMITAIDERFPAMNPLLSDQPRAGDEKAYVAMSARRTPNISGRVTALPRL
jgi:trans-aconitate methyltransferase